MNLLPAVPPRYLKLQIANCNFGMDFNIYVTSYLTSSERRISPQWDLAYLKRRLEGITGIPPSDQTLLHYPTSTSNEVRILSDGQKYSEERDQATRVLDLNIAPYSRVHVTDITGNTDMNLDEENEQNAGFELSEEDYAKRTDSVLNWKRENKLGRFDPTVEQQRQKEAAQSEELTSKMNVGDRCRVISIQGERRGVVRFIGKIQALDKGENTWVGVEFDEPVGKNNGAIGDEQIFSCGPKHGSFLKPKQVEVGDYPPIDPFESDDEL